MTNDPRPPPGREGIKVAEGTVFSLSRAARCASSCLQSVVKGKEDGSTTRGGLWHEGYSTCASDALAVLMR